MHDVLDNSLELPQNILSEQAILGSILVNNQYLQRVADIIEPEHFFQPVHQRIYAAILDATERGFIATPISLRTQFDDEPALEQHGKAHYLMRLTSLASSVLAIESYAHGIRDLYLRRQLISIAQDIGSAARDEQQKTGKQQIEMAEQALFDLATEGTTDQGFIALKTSLKHALDRVEKCYQKNGELTGITTGFKALDELLGGFQHSDLIILAGRPSMGKTALAVNMAVHAAEALSKTSPDPKSPPCVGFFSLEMSSEQLSARILSMDTKINAAHVRNGWITMDHFTRLARSSKELAALPLFIDDTPALSISALRTRARRMKRKHNLQILFIDYLQLVRSSRKNAETRVMEVAEVTQGLKAIAKELDIPVIALSQLSRSVESREDKRPQLSDLRESGTIEQDADIVMFVYREEYYLARKEPTTGTEAHTKWREQIQTAAGQAEVIISKQRHGPIGNVLLRFDAETTAFHNTI